MQEGSATSSGAKSRVIRHATAQSIVSSQFRYKNTLNTPSVKDKSKKAPVLDFDSPRTQQACLNLGIEREECLKKQEVLKAGREKTSRTQNKTLKKQIQATTTTRLDKSRVTKDMQVRGSYKGKNVMKNEGLFSTQPSLMNSRLKYSAPQSRQNLSTFYKQQGYSTVNISPPPETFINESEYQHMAHNFEKKHHRSISRMNASKQNKKVEFAKELNEHKKRYQLIKKIQFVERIQEELNESKKRKLTEKMKSTKKRFFHSKKNMAQLERKEEIRQMQVLERLHSADAKVERVRRDLEKVKSERSIQSQQKLRRVLDFKRLRDEEENREASERFEEICDKMKRSEANREERVSQKKIKASLSLNNLREANSLAQQYESAMIRAREIELLGKLTVLERAQEKRNQSLCQKSQTIKRSVMQKQRRALKNQALAELEFKQRQETLQRRKDMMQKNYAETRAVQLHEKQIEKFKAELRLHNVKVNQERAKRAEQARKSKIITKEKENEVKVANMRKQQSQMSLILKQEKHHSRDFQSRANQDREKLTMTMDQLTRADLARRKEQRKLRESLGEIPPEVEELFQYTCPRPLISELQDGEEEVFNRKTPPKRRPSLLY